MPAEPVGPDSGQVGVSYRFSATLSDPDGDSVSGQFCWGADTNNWSGFVPSGAAVSETVSWSRAGDFGLRVRARDVHLAQSDWSELRALRIGYSPPDVPLIATEADTFWAGDDVTIYAFTSAPEGDSLWLQVDWGGGDTTYWNPAYCGGWEFSRTLLSGGSYPVRARARDVHGAVSDWSLPHTITVLGPAIEWFFSLGRCGASPAIARDGTIVVTRGHDIYAVDAAGTFKWSCPLPDDAVGSPAIAEDGTIYTLCADRNLYAVTASGALGWNYGVGAHLPDNSYYNSAAWAYAPAIGPEGTIYAAGDYLYALNADGSLKWRWGRGDSTSSVPAIGLDGTLYVQVGDSFLYALDPDTTLRWRATAGSGVNWRRPPSPAIAADGTIYASNYEDVGVVLRAWQPDGTPLREFAMGWGYASQPVVGDDGTVHCFGDGLYAIRPDGTIKWHYGSDLFESFLSPALAADGTCIATDVSYFDQHVCALGPDGARRWRFDYFNASAAPVIAADGTILAVHQSGLCAIAGSSPLAASGWPMMQHDARHSNWAGGH